MRFGIKAGDKKLDSAEVKRNIAIFSWFSALFIKAIGTLIAFKFIFIGEYFFAVFAFVLSVLVGYPIKMLVFNLSIKNAKKKYGDLLRDLVVVKLDKKRIVALSGLTIISSVILFISFMVFVVPNINIVNANKIVLGAHRGNSHDFIENTLPAFESAVENDKYKFIEFDIQYTKDKVLVVHHGPVYDLKFRELDYNVEYFTYSELLNVSYYHIPTYEEVLDLIAGKKPLNIEIKSQGNFEDDINLVDFVLEDVINRGIKESTLISSVSNNVLIYLKHQCLECETGKIMFVRKNIFFQFDTFASEIIDEFEISKADYLMLHGSQLRNYNVLKKLIPENKTLGFWYLFIDDKRQDEMYVIEPSEDSWLFLLGKEAKASYSPMQECLWWC